MSFGGDRRSLSPMTMDSEFYLVVTTDDCRRWQWTVSFGGGSRWLSPMTMNIKFWWWQQITVADDNKQWVLVVTSQQIAVTDDNGQKFWWWRRSTGCYTLLLTCDNARWLMVTAMALLPKCDARWLRWAVKVWWWRVLCTRACGCDSIWDEWLKEQAVNAQAV